MTTYNNDDAPTGDAQTIIDVATRAAEPKALDVGNIYGWLTPDGQVKKIDLTGDEHRDQPKRKNCTVHLDDIDSFLHYWKKHATTDSDLYVDVERCQITCVLDAHTRDSARWEQHRAILALETSDRWKDWTRSDRKPMRQVVFAEFIEDHLDDIREPSAANMLEIAQTFQANTKVKFSSGVTLANGTRRLLWEETTDARAGESGKLDVPTTFKIGIAPFDFSETAYVVNARLRYKVESGQLYILYLLDDADAVIRDAVLNVVKKVEEMTSQPVMRGAPA